MNKASSSALDTIVDDGPNLVELRKLSPSTWVASRKVTWLGPGSFHGRGATAGEAIAELCAKVEADRAAYDAEQDLAPALEASLAAVRAR